MTIRRIAVLLVLALACGGGGGGGGGETATALIPAATGGSIRLGNGTLLEIPPGALAADTMITVRAPGGGALHPEGLRAGVILEPEGLTFSTPATLTLPYDGSGLEEPDDLVLVMASSLNPERDARGERDRFVIVEDAVREEDRLLVPVRHFTVFAFLYYPKMYIAPIIPGRYLRNGDILYSLTYGVNYNGLTSTPIHVGMFIQDASHDRVIESTVADDQCTPTRFSGVDEGTYGGAQGFIHLCGGHAFIGARRPIRATAAQGDAAVRAALPHVRSTGYGPLGFSTLGGKTCVQFVEDAWEEAGVNISFDVPDTLLLPANQMQNTTPVTEITINLSEGPVRIPIVAAVRETRSYYVLGGPGRLPVEMTLLPLDPGLVESGRATLEPAQLLPGDMALTAPQAQAAMDLVLRPTEEDVGFTWLLDLEVRVPSQDVVRRVSRFLRVRIEGMQDGSACPSPDMLFAGADGTLALHRSLDMPGAYILFQLDRTDRDSLGLFQAVGTMGGDLVGGATYHGAMTSCGGPGCVAANGRCPPDEYEPFPHDSGLSDPEVSISVAPDCRSATATARGTCGVTGDSYTYSFSGAYRPPP